MVRYEQLREALARLGSRSPPPARCARVRLLVQGAKPAVVERWRELARPAGA